MLAHARVRLLLIGERPCSPLNWDTALAQCRFVYDQVRDAASAARELARCRHDVTVIQRRLPYGVDGVELGCVLRELLPGLGIIMLDSDWDPSERRRLIERFADECLSDATELEELAALLFSLQRRARAAAGLACAISWGRLRVDFMGGFVEIAERQVALQPLQLRILGCLVQHAGSVVSREQLQRLVFRVSRLGSTSIPRQISVLRRQIGPLGAQIETHADGYALRLAYGFFKSSRMLGGGQSNDCSGGAERR